MSNKDNERGEWWLMVGTMAVIILAILITLGV